MTGKIERQVMAGVGSIYVARKLTGLTALKVYALVLSVWMIGRLVWVAKVFQNFSFVEKYGFNSAANYILYAVEHTHLAVQVTLLIAVAAFISLAVDAVRSLAAHKPQHTFAL